MAIRKDIVFTVADDGSVTPTTPQDGGVQGEHHATRVIFHVGENSVWENPDYTVYVECEDNAGNPDPTEPLEVKGGDVALLLPLAWTQYGGLITLRLVAEGADGTIAMTAEGLVRFDSRQNASQKVDGLLKGRLATMEKRISGLAACAEQAVGDVASAKVAAEKAAASAAVSGDGAQLAAKEAKKAVSGKLDKFDTDEYSFCLCDEEGNVIAAHDKNGKPLTKDPDRDQQMQEILDILATLSAGRLTTFYTADYAWCFCDEDGNVCCGALPTGEKVGFGGGDGWEQALQEVWDAIDNLPAAGGTTAATTVDYTKRGLTVVYLQEQEKGAYQAMIEAAQPPNYKKLEKFFDYTLRTAKGTNKFSGTCKLKFQGSSSLRNQYPKYNLTFEAVEEAFDATAAVSTRNGEEITLSPWGEQKKYCLKANWIDPSAARNVVNAKVWGKIVESRASSKVVSAVTDLRATAPNKGAIDGFPCIVIINGEFNGLYTFNIPKDGWMFGMGESLTEYVVSGEENGKPACGFYEEATFIEDEKGKVDYSVEYTHADANEEDVVTSFNTAIRKIGEAAAALANDPSYDWESAVSPYFDIDSAIDYYIFICCINAHDNLRRNTLYATYDGHKWFMSAYDLDTTYGSNPYGTGLFPIKTKRTQFLEAATVSTSDGGAKHRLFELIYKYSFDKLKERYWELRNTVLSNENVWYMLNNFVNAIPRAIYNMDAEKWADKKDVFGYPMPGTTTANVENYMQYYRMHCALLDKEMEE